MKKALLFLGVVCVVVAGGAWYFLSNLDALVKSAIETSGTNTMGSAVTVGEVDIDLRAGSALVRDLRVANPEGFSTEDMLSFSELSIVLDPANISRREIGILAITASNPRVLYQVKEDGTRNLDVAAARLRGEGAATTGATEPQPQGTEDLMLNVANVDITGIEAALNAPRLPATVLVPLGDIHLQNLRGTPDTMAQQLMTPVMDQLSQNAGNALLAATTNLLKEDAQSLGSQLKDRAAQGLHSAGDAISSGVKSAREGLSNLFNRDDDEPAPAPTPAPDATGDVTQ
jgi:hypothetical protein